jgi:ABC-2 type transport system ATP-binding protein
MEASMSSAMIELRRLHRQFGSVWAVRDISFEVHRGEVFGYIGPNGAGKTTSMRILASLDIPTRGDAWVAGYSVINDPDQVRRQLGFMPDAFGTYPNVNCFEYLDFFGRAYGLMGAERSRALRKVMSFTGLDLLAEKPIRGLSKGMKQRLCLGRALIHDPAVLVMDEPAAGLDPRARIELREMIGQLAADGKSILISSHILTELAEMCHRIGIIERGKLLATGTVEEVRQRYRPHREVKLRVLGDPQTGLNWLQSQPLLRDIQLVEGRLQFAHGGGEDEEADILRAMIAGGLRVVEFGSHTISLEDVFLQVTRGEVQ